MLVNCKYVQFSDHNIAPTSGSFPYLSMAVRVEALFDELEDWPTYYPSKFDWSRNCPRDVDALIWTT